MNNKNLNKTKLTTLLFAVGVSFGAYALPNLNSCNNWCQQCIAQGDDECSAWWSSKCYRYTGPDACFPEK